MKFIDQSSDITQLEENVRNAFKWEWLERLDTNDDRIQLWCKKINSSGQAYCVWCNSQLKYGSEGFKALTHHSKTLMHVKNAKIIKGSLRVSHFANAASVDETVEQDRPLDIITRKARQEVLISSFIAENSLPFSLAPKLIQLCQTLSRDQTALDSLSMNRTTVCYKLKYGLSKTIKEKVVKTLQHSCFSLTVDESTSNAEDSILEILVQYFCEEQNQIVVQHLASVKLEACNALSVYTAIVEIIETNNIPWKNLISVLMDSCNTMRGKKSGVEVRLRSNKAPHLLDIDGDTCHTVNNSAKIFTACFEHHLENLFDDIYYDLKSASKREKFFNLCTVLGVKKLKPLRRPDHRWLYLLPVLKRIRELWDVLLVFYFCFMSKTDKEIYLSHIEEIYEKKNIQSSQKKIIQGIYDRLKSQSLTKEAESRKQRIISSLFFVQPKTLLHMSFFNSVLPEFDSYVKLFEHKKPMLHNLHTRLYQLFSRFVTFFVKPEVISRCKSYKDLLALNVNDVKNHLSENLLYVGIEATNILKKLTKKHTIAEEFKSSLKKAYVSTAQHMLQKLPIGNSLFINFSCFDPELRGKSTTMSAFFNLSSHLSHIFSEAEMQDLDLEIRLYQTDMSVTEMLHSFDGIQKKLPMDEYWYEIFKLRDDINNPKFPVLSKLIKACLTCFHGPMIESAFNFMDNIITDTRTSLKIDSLDAVQTVKYYLMSTNSTTCEKYGCDDPKTTPMDKNLIKNVLGSWNAYQQDLKGTMIQSNNAFTESSSCGASNSAALTNVSEKADVIAKEQDSLLLPNMSLTPVSSKRKLDFGKCNEVKKQKKLEDFFK